VQCGRERGAIGVAAFVAAVVASSLGLAVVGPARRGATQEVEPATVAWRVRDGYAIDVAAKGFSLPSAIAFVPEPGPDDDDVRYFVTELRGTVKAVTNDGEVRDFAAVETFEAEFELPDPRGQSGLAGICLDPARGHVFVTFTRVDGDGILRNDLVRFTTTPGRFGLEPSRPLDLGDPFDEFQSAPAHQIGGCVVDGDRVFVGIGDGGNPSAVDDLDVLLGKVVCLTVDGAPCPDGPFASSRAGTPAAYVWAWGLRNPFGLARVDGELYVAGNGIEVDQFLRIRKGEDHFWDGTDASIATGADVVFAPSLSPVQLGRYPADATYFDETERDSFFFAVGGFGEPAGVMEVPFDVDAEQPTGVPRYLVEHRAEGEQYVAGLAFGPDGLYMVPMLPDARGESAIFRIRYDPGAEHAYVIGEDVEGLAEGQALMVQHGCFGCHSIGGEGGDVGPALDRFSLNQRTRLRVNASEYAEQVARVDEIDEEPWVSWRDERREVLAANGDERLRRWIKFKLLEPKFDDPQAQMPQLHLTETEAETIRDYLLSFQRPRRTLVDRVRDNLEPIAAGFGAGVAVAAGVAVVVVVVLRWRRRARAPA
jgi:hypothetical protein